MGVQAEIDRINNNIQNTLNTIADTGVAVGTGSDALPAAAAALANEKADITLLRTVTLTVAGWADNAQTVSVQGATATNAKVVSPAPASVDEYASCGVKAAAEGAGTITFACTTVPENVLTVNIAILG